MTLYRLITICYTILVQMTVFCMILSSLLTDFKSRRLAYRAWLPFNHSIASLYYIAYSHQIVALIGTSLLNVACDVILCGFCVHACAQQEILAHRLKEITQSPRSEFGNFIQFHNYLYGLVPFHCQLPWMLPRILFCAASLVDRDQIWWVS